MTWMRGMTQMKSERVYFVGRHCDLATFTRNVVSKNEKGSVFGNKKPSLRGNATPGHTVFKKGRSFENKQKRRGNASPAGAEPRLFHTKFDFELFVCRCLVGL